MDIPRHVGIIPDGNRRYADEIGSGDYLEAYQKGAEVLKESIGTLFDEGVDFVTVYAFSHYNFAREETEKQAFFYVFGQQLAELGKLAKDKDARVEFVGHSYRFPESLQTEMKTVSEETAPNSEKRLYVLADYAASEMRTETYLSPRPDDLPEDKVEVDALLHGFPKDTPYVDFMIRTSGEQRFSDFPLSEQAELYFPEIYWPEFSKEETLRALKEFQKRKRRKGK